MDSSELAAKMLTWEQKKQELDSLETEIKAAVLELGETQTVGNVRASYSKGRRKFDYRAAVERAEQSGDLEPGSLGPYEKWDYDYKQAAIDAGILLEPYSIVTIDYTSAAKGLNLEIPFTQSDPSVTIKLL